MSGDKVYHIVHQTVVGVGIVFALGIIGVLLSGCYQETPTKKEPIGASVEAFCYKDLQFIYKTWGSAGVAVVQVMDTDGKPMECKL